MAKPALYQSVALLAEQPDSGLARGQVGTVVETPDANSVLVEFSDDEAAPMPSSLAPIPT